MDDIPQDSDASVGHSVVIGLIQIDLRLPLCHSLKAKRGILAKLLNHLRKQYPISIAEVADQNSWGRAGLAAVTVSGERSVVENTMRRVLGALEHEREVEVVDASTQLL